MIVTINNEQVEIPDREPYKLRPYFGYDYYTKSNFVGQKRCRVCGHHLHRDQVIAVGNVLCHSDIRICLALILMSGHKYEFME
jgi:hypothetical protein